MTHKLKTWPEHFNDVWRGDKTCELRKNDRDFSAHDNLLLQEYEPESESYTGREILVHVWHMLEDFTGLEKGYCILSIRVKAKYGR